MKKVVVLAVVFITYLLVPPVSYGQETQGREYQTKTESEHVPGSQAEASGNVTMDFKEADIHTVLRLLSLKSRMNIVAGPEVQGTVTIRLENVPWEQALQVVLRTYGYVYEKVGNIIRVTTSEKMEQEELITETFSLEYIQLSKRSDRGDAENSGGEQTSTTANEIVEIVTTMLSERGRVKMVSQRNALVVTDTPTNVYKIGEIIRGLDRHASQVFIDSKVIKTQLDKGENLGIRWNIANVGIGQGSVRPTSFPFQTAFPGENRPPASIKDHLERFLPPLSGTTQTATTTSSSATANSVDSREFPLPAPKVANETFTFGTLDFSTFSALLSMLQSRTNTKVVSNPRIVVLDNQTAKVKVGSEIPIPTFERNETTGSFEVTGFDYRDVGVVLDVTPHINSAQEILVDLKPEVSSLGSTISFTSTLAAPSFDVTNAETQVLIRSGETIAIGGLLENKFAISEQKVPYLGSIPGIGKLFRSKRQTEGSANRNVETLFFVTVTLVDTEGQPTGQKRDAGQSPGLSQETLGSQTAVKASTPPLTPTKAGTG